ncbi:Phosphatidylethanolamine N-methyltransferase [Chondrus crispus]|uniref:Phosphatidylethanolamine N-methyltransferase n=1 Tax=Chondrus crispus TaxID=2769 RepID=R7QC06_CHOCR|nr:Phosphatidylethanolamine N-methyltransferase [Chondrus crispus]CDF35604.1 Phosphatidylethanolamine N-methyltransferase [Chondrus crispus]|eukprot:XP_005715423.1 Phosphatidylethanolamine N-methyltransferase [Chondrus crispus]
MDLIMEKANEIWSIAEQYMPSPLPVPGAITSAAEFLSAKATSPSFPYTIRDVNLGSVVFWQAGLVILLQPIIWNVLARLEHYTRILSKAFGSPVRGTYALGLWIFAGGIYRDLMFVEAMDRQRKVGWLAGVEYQVAGLVGMAVGLVLVLSSAYQLGVVGTYLGDYFGILMEKRVTGFPFNMFSDPMYDGSTLLFMGRAIVARSPAGIVLSGWVYVVYRLACMFEGPFTAKIYAERERQQREEKEE